MMLVARINGPPLGQDQHGPVDPRRCKGCGSSLEHKHPSAAWCSDACKSRHRPRPGPTARAAAVVPAAPSGGNLEAVVQLLLAAGCELVVVVDGVELVARAR